MNTIYIDTLFFINCITDYFALLCAGKICSAVLDRVKIGIAAVIGGLYACACVFAGFHWLTSPALKLVFGILLCLIAYGNERSLFRCCVTFLLVSAAFGGIVSAFATGTNDALYLPVNFKVLLLTFAAAYFALSVLFRQFSHTRCREFHNVSVIFRGNEISFTALKDTGNELFDPISNTPVLICEYRLLASLFPETDLTCCQTDPFTLFSAINSVPHCPGKIRLIPFQTVSGQGYLVGFKPDQVLVDHAQQNLIIAMTDTQLSRDNTYQAIY